MEEKPNFYSIIPATVRYDKELSANAKLLYGEISSLCNKEGCCWATNKYFADLYEVSERSITNWLSLLQKKEYIEIINSSNGGRKIFLGGWKKFSRGVEKIFYHNNKTNNKNNINNINNKEIDIELFDYDWVSEGRGI